MTLDNDGHPNARAGAIPSDPPPRRAPDANDAARASIARAIVQALPLDVRAVLGAILAAWFATLAGVARAVDQAKRAGTFAPASDVALALDATARSASEALAAAASAPGAYAAAAALSALWCDGGPFDAAAHVAAGHFSAAELEAFAAELGAALDAGAGQTDAGGVAAPHRTPAEAPSKSTSTDDATTDAPRIVRCPMPAGVDRVDVPGGPTFLPDDAPTSSPARDPYLRAILGAAPRGLALACALSVAAWARTLAALVRVVDAAEELADAAPRPDCTTGEGLARAFMACAPREVARAAAVGANGAVLAGVEGAAVLWRTLTAAAFGASPAELARLHHGAEGLDAFAAELEAFAAAPPPANDARAGGPRRGDGGDLEPGTSPGRQVNARARAPSPSAAARYDGAGGEVRREVRGRWYLDAGRELGAELVSGGARPAAARRRRPATTPARRPRRG